jgi:hypothetical protein
MFKKGDLIEFLYQGQWLEGEVESCYTVFGGATRVRVIRNKGTLHSAHYHLDPGSVRYRAVLYHSLSSVVGSYQTPLVAIPPSGRQLMTGRASCSVPNVQTLPKPKCTCGAEKCGSPGHSSWCDIERGMA